MKAIRIKKSKKHKVFKYSEIREEGWYRDPDSAWYLLFLKDVKNKIGPRVAVNSNTLEVCGLSEEHSWNKDHFNFVKQDCLFRI